MQGLMVPASIVDEIARVHIIVDGRTHKTHGRKSGRLCRTMPAGATKMSSIKQTYQQQDRQTGRKTDRHVLVEV